MNAERLNALLHHLRDDLKRTNLKQLMTQLTASLQQLVQNPHPQHNQNVSAALKAVLAAVENSQIDSLSPAWKQMLEEIGYSECMGQRVAERLNDSFRQAEITPSIVKEEVDKLNAEVTKLDGAINNGIKAFSALTIGFEDLGAGECELGFLIPKASIDFRLDEFADECREFDFIFGTFSEIVTGERDGYRIRTISSSDLSVFLDSAPAVAALIAATAERILALYKQLLEIKKLRSEMLKQDIPVEAFEAIDTHENTKLESSITEISAKIISDYRGQHEAGRANELENSLRISLNKLANRFDRGFHLEVRVGSLPEPKEGDEDKHAALATSIQTIEKAAKPLQFVRPEGEPILRLPEAQKKQAAKKSTSKQSKPKG